jgi:hypothetical protein
MTRRSDFTRARFSIVRHEPESLYAYLLPITVAFETIVCLSERAMNRYPLSRRGDKNTSSVCRKDSEPSSIYHVGETMNRLVIWLRGGGDGFQGRFRDVSFA